MVAPFLIADSPFNGSRIDHREADSIAIAWLNMLSAEQIDRFLWDYPRLHGCSPSGYGLGKATARRLVEARRQLPAGFQTIEEVRAVPGVGEDKVADLRMQAKEAIALGRYENLPTDPLKLWIRLLTKGPGRPLIRLLRSVQLQLRRTIAGWWEASSVDLRIPYVALAIQPPAANPDVSQFTRVRIDPWAFGVHQKKDVWLLCMKREPRNTYKINLVRAIDG